MGHWAYCILSIKLSYQSHGVVGKFSEPRACFEPLRRVLHTVVTVSLVLPTFLGVIYRLESRSLAFRAPCYCNVSLRVPVYESAALSTEAFAFSSCHVGRLQIDLCSSEIDALCTSILT
jgi:hypothetical protein